MVANPLRRALIIGCSENVWEEIERAQDLSQFDAIYCVKLAGVHYPAQFKTWVTLHPEWMDAYEKERHELGHPNGYEIVMPPDGELGDKGKAYGKRGRRVSYRFQGMNASASSGIYGAKVALDDGYERVVLAGIPMEREFGHFTRKKPWVQRDSFIPGWERSIPFLKGRVRSMSGLTAEILGTPDPRWLNGETP